MPLHTVQIGTSTDPLQLSRNVSQAFGTLVTQLNAAAGKLSSPLNAHGNPIHNLPAPTADGDPVTLGHLTSVLATASSNLNNTLNRSSSSYKNVPRPYHCIFKAAIAQNGTALLGMNWATPTNPIGTVISIGQLYFAGMIFTGSTLVVQDHFPLPEDWVPSSLDCIVNWYAPDGGGDTATWSVQFAHATNGATGTQTFNAIATNVASIASGPSFVISTITNVLVTSNATNSDFQAGDEVFFNFGAAAVTGTAILIDLKFLVRRAVG
jgi:hypothetical protein